MNTPDPSRDDTREVNEHEEISRRAYALWEQRGRRDGEAEDDWYAAERAYRGDGEAGEPRAVPGVAAREPIPTAEPAADEPLAERPGSPPRRPRGRTTL